LGGKQVFGGNLAMSIKDAFEVFINIFHRGGTQPMEDASHSDPVISMG
jgi:hypothetical protein